METTILGYTRLYWVINGNYCIMIVGLHAVSGLCCQCTAPQSGRFEGWQLMSNYLLHTIPTLDYIGVILGYWKRNGNYYIGVTLGLYRDFLAVPTLEPSPNIAVIVGLMSFIGVLCMIVTMGQYPSNLQALRIVVSIFFSIIPITPI